MLTLRYVTGLTAERLDLHGAVMDLCLLSAEERVESNYLCVNPPVSDRQAEHAMRATTQIISSIIPVQ